MDLSKATGLERTNKKREDCWGRSRWLTVTMYCKEWREGANTFEDGVQNFMYNITINWLQPWEVETVISVLKQKNLVLSDSHLCSCLSVTRFLQAQDLNGGTSFCNQSIPAEFLHAQHPRSLEDKRQQLLSLFNFFGIQYLAAGEHSVWKLYCSAILIHNFSKISPLVPLPY